MASQFKFDSVFSRVKIAFGVFAAIFAMLLSVLNWSFDFGAVLLANSAAHAADDELKYAGLEYYGSSQMTRKEIEQILRLKVGGSARNVEQAVARLRKTLDDRHLIAVVDSVASGQGVYVVADIEETKSGEELPMRVLENPHHVRVKSEKPSLLLIKLDERLQKLIFEGRKSAETYPGGVKMYSDEPANQLVEELRRFGPPMRSEWLSIVVSDPDPERRVEAIRLLNWAGNYEDTCARLVPALDDSSHLVRGEVVRFIFPRLPLLSDNFPFNELAAGLCRQIMRPSHEDRSKGLYCIIALLRMRPLLTAPMKQCAEKKVRTLADESIIPTVKEPAEHLLKIFSGPMPRPQLPPEEDRFGGF